jgi:uncharacterized protein YbbK (DUF523 family)
MAKRKVMLSACLAGVNCVYDGSNKAHPVFKAMAQAEDAVLFCPEVLGGFKIPHPPSEISVRNGGDGDAVLRGAARLVSREGIDVTVLFMKGAKKALALAKKLGIKYAIMKARSPSCGCGKIYDGTFSRTLIEGFGVTAALLKENGVEVISDEEYLKGAKGDKPALREVERAEVEGATRRQETKKILVARSPGRLVHQHGA